MTIDTKNLRNLALESNDGYLRGPALAAADDIDAMGLALRCVSAALQRYGVADGDDPGEAIDVLIAKKSAEIEQLRSALSDAVATIQDYLDYDHDGDPWSEDARTMGEMDINDYARDGRMERARAALTPQEPA